MTIKHETPADTRRERIVAAIIEREWGVTLQRCEGEYASTDYWIMRNGGSIGVMELKCRANPSTKYATIFFATTKYKELMKIATQHSILPLFVAAFTDGVVYGINARHTDDMGVGIVRRTKPRLSGEIGINDTEPAICVPINAMKLMGKMSASELLKYAP